MVKLWKFLSGKKTSIAAFLNLLTVWVSQKGWLEQEDLTLIATGISIWTGIAISHQIKKKVSKK